MFSCIRSHYWLTLGFWYLSDEKEEQRKNEIKAKMEGVIDRTKQRSEELKTEIETLLKEIERKTNKQLRYGGEHKGQVDTLLASEISYLQARKRAKQKDYDTQMDIIVKLQSNYDKTLTTTHVYEAEREYYELRRDLGVPDADEVTDTHNEIDEANIEMDIGISSFTTQPLLTASDFTSSLIRPPPPRYYEQQQQHSSTADNDGGDENSEALLALEAQKKADLEYCEQKAILIQKQSKIPNPTSISGSATTTTTKTTTKVTMNQPILFQHLFSTK